MPYLVFVTAGLCAAYLLVFFAAPPFFGIPVKRGARPSLYSLIAIVLLSAAAYALAYSVADPWWSNRVLHILGGGVVGSFTVYRAARDAKLALGVFRSFAFIVMLVTTLGVCNELTELVLQTQFGFISSTTPTDTWLDLASNTVGILLASAVFAPLLRDKR